MNERESAPLARAAVFRIAALIGSCVGFVSALLIFGAFVVFASGEAVRTVIPSLLLGFYFCGFPAFVGAYRRLAQERDRVVMTRWAVLYAVVAIVVAVVGSGGGNPLVVLELYFTVVLPFQYCIALLGRALARRWDPNRESPAPRPAPIGPDY